MGGRDVGKLESDLFLNLWLDYLTCGLGMDFPLNISFVDCSLGSLLVNIIGFFQCFVKLKLSTEMVLTSIR